MLTIIYLIFRTRDFSFLILWGVLTKVLNLDNPDEIVSKPITYKELADAIVTADTTGWAESYTEIEKRIWDGFESIAKSCENKQGGNDLVMTHGYTIAFFLSLIDSSRPIRFDLKNGSITTVSYDDGKFTIHSVNDVHYIENGKKELKTS
ncbi:histidine phosphatase family protein [Enterococcus sp. AZ072]|uniref:histidine phosphatase family protein n=1 Tax=unclassified Enterococcus TaxID=2608891 RepID=UPI003D2A43BD